VSARLCRHSLGAVFQLRPVDEGGRWRSGPDHGPGRGLTLPGGPQGAGGVVVKRWLPLTVGILALRAVTARNVAPGVIREAVLARASAPSMPLIGERPAGLAARSSAQVSGLTGASAHSLPHRPPSEGIPPLRWHHGSIELARLRGRSNGTVPDESQPTAWPPPRRSDLGLGRSAPAGGAESRGSTVAAAEFRAPRFCPPVGVLKPCHRGRDWRASPCPAAASRSAPSAGIGADVPED
jgi:hypothetical protein